MENLMKFDLEQTQRRVSLTPELPLAHLVAVFSLVSDGDPPCILRPRISRLTKDFRIFAMRLQDICTKD